MGYYFEIREFNVQTLVLKATEVEYAQIFLHFVYGLTLRMEEGKDRKVGIGRGAKLVNNQEIQLALANRVQVFSETITGSMLGLTDVLETTSGAPNAEDELEEVHVKLCPT